MRLLLVLLIAGLADDALAETVTVAGGRVSGVEANGVEAFKGIPYAASPIGDLRWRAPQPVVAWNGVRDGGTYGHDCMQAPLPQDPAPITTAPSEDCLYVNVWRPDNSGADKLPVLVWIHGGGFVNGGSSILVNDGSQLAGQGIVVVSLNYRLGRLGFFAHPALLQAQPGEAGNFGIMDQIAALKWVRDDIAAFGGDPTKITLLGESAGGGSVLDLLTSPAAAGLFHGAMIMSGGGRVALLGRPMTGGAPDLPAAADGDAAYARTLGIEGLDSTALAALRALPAEMLVAGWTLPVVLGAVLGGTHVYDGTPMIDGVIVTATPQEIFARAAEAKVPVIIGTTARDLPVQLPPRAEPFSWFGEEAEAAARVFDPDGTLAPDALVLGIGADMTMHEPARFVAQSVTKAGRPAWLYRFSYASPAEKDGAGGAAHGQDVPYVFDTVDLRYGAATTDNDRAMAHAFAGYLVNFVKTGNPHGPALPQWPQFDSRRYELMNFGLDGPSFGADPRAARIELVERAFDRAAQAAK